MFTPLFIQEYLVFHGSILSACLLGCIFVLAQALSMMGAFGER